MLGKQLDQLQLIMQVACATCVGKLRYKLSKKNWLMQVRQCIHVVLRRQLDVAAAQLHRTQLGTPAVQLLSMHMQLLGKSGQFRHFPERFAADFGIVDLWTMLLTSLGSWCRS